MAAPSSLASSHLSRLAAAAPAPQHHHQNHQLRLGCSRRRAQRLVAMAGSGKFFVGGNWKCVSTRRSLHTPTGFARTGLRRQRRADGES